MPITWTKDFETGETHVDAQHRRLIDYTNELHDMIVAAQNGESLKRRDVDDLLFHLESYVTVHFAYEEMCMAMRRCPKAAENKDAHEKLLQFYGKFLEQAKEQLTLPMLIELEKTLVSWLTNHICRIDVKLRDTAIPKTQLRRRR